MVETNVCFPTDLKLLGQSGEKCLSLIGKLRLETPLLGWGKMRYWHKLLSASGLRVSRIYRSKGRNYEERLKSAVEIYLEVCTKIRAKLEDSLLIIKGLQCELAKNTPRLTALKTEFILFFAYFAKHQDLVHRRIINGEKIPHDEKIFSLYEPHTEWISKGKANKKVELGHAVCITTNQQHFCMHWQVMEKQTDVVMPLIISEFVQNNFGKYCINSWSFDRGFSSKENLKMLEKQVDCTVMLKKGKLSKKDKERESEPEFKKHRENHSTVEANINQLEHLGAGKCPDKGINGFKRYVGLAVIAYNIHRIGKICPKY